MSKPGMSESGVSSRTVWATRLGLLLVAAAFVGTAVAASLQTIGLLDRVSKLDTPACVGAAHPSCVAQYAGTVAGVDTDKDPAIVEVRSAFLATGDVRDECFGRWPDPEK